MERILKLLTVFIALTASLQVHAKIEQAPFCPLALKNLVGHSVAGIRVDSSIRGKLFAMGISEREFADIMNSRMGMAVRHPTQPEFLYFLAGQKQTSYFVVTQIERESGDAIVMDIHANPSGREQGEYFFTLAHKLGIKDYDFRLARPLNGLSEVHIPEANVTKIRFKHHLNVQMVVNAMNGRSSNEVEAQTQMYRGQQQTRYVLYSKSGDTLMKIVYKAERKRLVVIAAYDLIPNHSD